MAKRQPGELSHGQKYALWLIWRVDGVSASHCTATLPGGKPHRIHAGTIVVLVGRGLLYGFGGMVRATEAGQELARTL